MIKEYSFLTNWLCINHCIIILGFCPKCGFGIKHESQLAVVGPVPVFC